MRLPDYKFVQGGNTRVNMSPQAASAAGRGFARMSEDLAGVGMQVAGLFEKAEEVHDQGKMIELQTEMDQMYASYSEQMMRTPNDALKWREGWDKLTSDKQMELDKRDMSGNLRQRVNMFTSKYYGQKGISVSHNAMRTEVENTRGIARARLDHLDKQELYKEGAELTEMLVKGNVLPKDEGEKRRLHFEREQNFSVLDKEMKTNPAEFSKNYTDGKYENSGVNPSRLASLYQDSLKIQKDRSINASKSLNNIMKGTGFESADEMTKTELWAELTPSQQFEHMESYYKFNDDKLRLKYQDPKNRPELDGQILNLFSQMRNNNIDSTVGIAQVSSLLNIMPDDSQKKVLQSQLDDIEAGVTKKKKTQLDLAKELVDVQFDQLQDNNPKPKPIEVTRKQAVMLDDDFFTEENLKGYGIKEKYIDDIIAAKGEVGAISGRNTQVIKSEQFKLFERLLKMPKARDESVTITGERKQIRDSILGGQPSDVISGVIDKKSQAQWLRVQRDIDIKRAKAHNETIEYMNAYPNATPKDVNKFISNGDVLIKSSTGSSIIEDAPKRDVIPVIPSGASMDLNENPWGKLGGDLLEFESDEELAELLQQGKEAQLAVDIKDEEKKRVASNSKK